MAFKDRFKQARTMRGLTQEQLGAYLNIAKSTVAGYERGSSEPDMAKLQKAMNVLNVDANFLFQDEMSNRDNFTKQEIEMVQKYRALDRHGRKVVDAVLDIEYNNQEEPEQNEATPLYSMNNFLIRASAGTGNFLDSDDYETIQLTEKPPRGADFIIDVCGDSMEPTFEDGDKVYVHRQEVLEPGEIGIFYYDGDAYIKEYQPGRLVSHNKAYNDVILSEYLNVRCYGRVIGTVDPDSIYG